MGTRGSKAFRHWTFQRRTFQNWIVALIASGWLPVAFALGTASDTPVVNNVTVDHQLSGVAQPQQTASAQFRVDNRINYTLTATGATVSPGQTNRVISFLITNNGNSTQGFALAVDNSTVADNFNMNNVRIYVDNGDNTFNAATDTLHCNGLAACQTATNNATNVLANGTLRVYVVADVPGGGSAPADGSTARYDLLVSALNNASTTEPTNNSADAWLANSVQNVFDLANTTGPHVGNTATDSRLSATGTFSVNAPSVSIVKSATVLAPLGGTDPVTGATITYTLTVSVSGGGSADSVVVTDAIPANTTYVSPSITLNGVAQTNAVDGDAGSFNGTTISVNLGTLTSASPVQTIRFSVTIN